jgi:lysophospholipase L1-like esterase
MQNATRISAEQKIGLIVLGIFLSLILLEGGMRLAGFTLSSIQEYKNKVSIKEKGTCVIMCLGESTTADEGLNGTHCYPSQLKDILNTKNTGIKFSVINKGVSGTNTTRILSELKSNLERYKPNMVIAMMGINDEGSHMPHEAESSSKIMLFFQSLKIYKLSRFIWLHAAAKARETQQSNCAIKTTKGIEPKKYVNNRTAIENKKEFYAELAKDYDKNGNFSGESNALNEAIKLDPGNAELYFKLQLSYRLQGEFEKAESVLKEIIDKFPDQADAARAFLLTCYKGEGKDNEMFALFNDTANRNNFTAHFEIWVYYVEHNDYAKAGEMIKKMSEIDNLLLITKGVFIAADSQLENTATLLKEKISRDPKDAKLYAFLALIYNEMNKSDISKRYFSIAEELRLKYYNNETRENYRKLKEILNKENIKLVCVQYPMRSILPLKKIFEDDDKGIIFVDNEEIFKNAVMKAKYNDYFLDAFGGDFGHCTPVGNRLLAENIAKSIVRQVRY